jgi:aspartyl/asparaginyl-tRNA synthetase
LILPFGGETVGAAEREFKYEQVYERLKRSNMLSQLERRGGSINDFDWYLNYLRENGSVPHAGDAVGLNRVMQFVMGSCDIRESTLFPSNRETLM